MSLFKRLWSSLPAADGETPTAPNAQNAPAADPAAEATWPACERRLRKRLNAKNGLSALIIDDSPTIVAALGKVLRSAGYVTVEAGDAERGLELAKQLGPCMIFLDIVLPGMNGFAALRLIRKDAKLNSIPVIMISGNEHATEQFYANRIGADDFMKKPFSRYEIFSRIENMLDAELIPRRKTASSAHAAAAQNSPATTQTPGPAASAPSPAIVADPLPAAIPPSAELSAAASMLAARKELAAMGLKYFDQTEYEAAVRRHDLLAVELFVRAGAIRPLTGGKPGAADLASLPLGGQPH